MLKTIAASVHADIHKKLKSHCVYHDLVISDLVAELVCDYLRKYDTSGLERKK